MKKTLIISSAVILIGLTVACSNQSTQDSMQHKSAAKSMSTGSVDQSSFQALLSTAKSSLSKAKSAGGEWRDSGKLLKKATTAAKEGNYVAAIKHIKVVSFQAKRGYEQIMSQKNVGNPNYLYN